MAIEKFEFDMYSIGDRAMEGVMTNVEVNTETNQVSIDYAEQSGRVYVEGLGAPGTADYWLDQARDMLKTNWENWVD